MLMVCLWVLSGEPAGEVAGLVWWGGRAGGGVVWTEAGVV